MDGSLPATVVPALDSVDRAEPTGAAVDVGEIGAQEAAAAPDTASPEAETPRSPSAAPHVDLARWRAATRGSDGDRPLPALGRPESSAGQSAAAAPVAGQAATRLAQALGRTRPYGMDAAEVALPAAPADVAGANPAGFGAAAGLASPSSRPSDIALRLAQAGGQGASGQEGAPPPSLVPAIAPPATAAPPAAAMAQAGPVSPTLPPEVADQVIQQVVSSLKMQWKDGVGEARLHLRPDALGSVSVSLRVEGGAVTAVVRAENPQVQEWVLQHQQTLRQQMEAAGLHLDEFVVSPDDQRQQSREDSSPDPQRRRPRPARSDDSTEAPRFELLA
jgi:flagellar hook-length control protein FliK